MLFFIAFMIKIKLKEKTAIKCRKVFATQRKSVKETANQKKRNRKRIEN